jgi:hypothetical protein
LDGAAALGHSAGSNGPWGKVQQDFLWRLDEGLGEGVGCSFVVGSRLTKKGEPYLVFCHCGELFTFQLSLGHAARLKVDDSMLIAANGRTPHNHHSRGDSLVRLEAIEINGLPSRTRIDFGRQTLTAPFNWLR